MRHPRPKAMLVNRGRRTVRVGLRMVAAGTPGPCVRSQAC
ncbi:hypothetical protein I551_8606 [Mycobacterium ulcerans str. Harvey]|uniref:Uncharacterized protein n=1 Tax=Mycobacterium ulcerans str. Harvey TaxID=1299332 RepID=A0ABN0RAH1_MYCUL|nr:hypothetical protein I551_8606 [Mycobacterium ulcerans str. Harvey]